MWTFKPEKQNTEIKAPFLEDARANIAPNYRSDATIQSAMAKVTAELEKLGAGVMDFQRGQFQIGEHNRHGYLIRFVLGGAIGVIRVAGLPIRSYTPAKETQARVQALLIVRDWLKAAVTAQVFNPDMHPLLPFLLLPDGRTVAELVNSGQLALPAGGDS
jgi:hypothetical protein